MVWAACEPRALAPDEATATLWHLTRLEATAGIYTPGYEIGFVSSIHGSDWPGPIRPDTKLGLFRRTR
jgi:hypothetical protein